MEVVPKIVTILTGDPDAVELRRQSLEALEAFGRRGGSGPRRLDKSFIEPHLLESAGGAIIKALRPQLASISGMSTSWRIRETWAKTLGTLANSG